MRNGQVLAERAATQFARDLLVAGNMELFIFARFHARPDEQAAVAEALAAVVPPSRAEPGCLGIHAFRALRDPLLFYIHSRWVDEAAFDLHATLPHTRRFIERVATLVDHPLDVVRTQTLL
jgi:quinol monooxygenase YgiN